MFSFWLLRFSLPLLVISFLMNSLTRPVSETAAILGTGQRILLLTAHPDDECLFFAPTILSLVSNGRINKGPELPTTAGNPASELYSLCLSVGDADGLGMTRRGELHKSLDVLGIESEKRWVVDTPDLQDNITLHWDPETISKVVKPYVLKHGITTILTFDRQGISSHPNHASLPSGVAHLISTLSAETEKATRLSASPRLFTLISVPLIHKYLGPVAPLLGKFDLSVTSVLQRFGQVPTGRRIPVFVSGFSEYRIALKAMMQHKSQLVWFRWLYVSFSRYMWVNEWIEVVPPTHTSVADSPIPKESS